MDETAGYFQRRPSLRWTRSRRKSRRKLRSGSSEDWEQNDLKRSDRGVLNEFSLAWVFPLMKKAWFGDYVAERDAPFLPSKLAAAETVGRAEEIYVGKNACRKNDSKKYRQLYWIVYELSRMEVLIGLLSSALQGVLTTAARPLLLRQIVLGLEDPDVDVKRLGLFIGLLGVLLVLEGLTAVTTKHALSDFFATKFVVVLGGLVERKTLKLPNTHSLKFNPSSLLGNDILRNFENAKFACLLPTAISSLICGIVVLIYTLGFASVPGFVVMVVMLVVNAWIASHAEKAEEQDLQAADERIKELTNVVNNIAAVKLSGWEERFINLLDAARAVELKHVFQFRLIAQGSVQIGRSTPYVCAAASFLYLVLTSDDVSSADVYAALNVFLSLRLSLIILPECISYVTAFNVSTRRVQAFLDLPEISPNEEHNDFSLIGPKFFFPNSTNAVDVPKSGLKFRRNSKTAVVGAVGSGKTALLQALLGEMNGGVASRPKNSSVAYVRQNPFVISGTIVENVFFRFNDERRRRRRRRRPARTRHRRRLLER